jgi:antitoxin VapB
MKPLERYAMLVICGRRWGLVASATRFVHFGSLPDELKSKQTACAYVDAIFNASTVAGAKVSDIFQHASKAYSEVGFPDEWKKHNQGGSAGYMSRDYEGTPTCEEIVLEEQAFAWNPSITGVKSEDTAIVHSTGLEFLTVTNKWPSLKIRVDSSDQVENTKTTFREWERPAILVND